MNCAEVQELLSAYFDGELDDETRETVDGHLSHCESCSQTLRGFERLSSMAHELPSPPTPSGLWPELERQLSETPVRQAAPGILPWMNRYRTRLALALLLLVVLGAGWFAVDTWRHSSEHAAVDFGQYLDAFVQNPQRAQQFLLAHYDGKRLDFDQARQQLGYEPAAADGLPHEFVVESVYVWQMPCCKCVQCLCKRNDGSTVALFEHNDDQPIWFGDLPAINVSCDGKPCAIYQVGHQIAASWDHDQRHITAVGLRDVNEVSELVASLEHRKSNAH